MGELPREKGFIDYSGIDDDERNEPNETSFFGKRVLPSGRLPQAMAKQIARTEEASTQEPTPHPRDKRPPTCPRASHHGGRR